MRGGGKRPASVRSHPAAASAAPGDGGDFSTEEFGFGLGVVLDGITVLVDRAGTPT